MIAAWLSLSPVVQSGIIAIVGAAIGAIANDAIYRWAYFSDRPISPWMSVNRFNERLAGDRDGSGANGGQLQPRRLWHRLPIVGWWGLSRESSVHGRWHWVRPMLIEVCMAVSLVWYYRYAIVGGGLLPEAARTADFLIDYRPLAVPMFVAHGFLAGLLVAATFIDFDEKTIPDEITVPGTLLGIVMGSISVHVFPPSAAGGWLLPTTFDSPWMNANPAVQPGSVWFGPAGLGLGCGIALLWCFALCDRRWTMAMVRRRGLFGAWRHFAGILIRSPQTKLAAALAVVMCVFIAAMFNIGGQTWLGCLTSLVGLAIGGGIVWSIRAVASGAMGRMAMGFGDVTLMAMIGSIVGWQGTLLAFFLAPFTAIVIVVVRYVMTGDKETPFGPYLAAGTVLTVLAWNPLFNQRFALQLQMLGGLIMWMAAFMLVAMAVLLIGWRLLSDRLFRR